MQIQGEGEKAGEKEGKTVTEPSSVESAKYKKYGKAGKNKLCETPKYSLNYYDLQTTRSDKEFIELIKATSGDILWDIIKKIHNRDEVGATTLITWCKPHVGIELNEKADELAKLGLQLPDNHIVPLTYDRDFKTSSGRDENSRGTRDPLTIHDKTELFEYFEKDDMERDKM
jgi:hypothetical protein